MIDHRIVPALLIALCASIVSGQDADQQPYLSQDETPTVNLYESQIRDAIDSYLAAINRGDASAAAEHWLESCKIVSADGSRLEGKTAILQDLQSSFADNQRRQVSVFDVSIRFLAPTVAVEEGVARVVNGNGETSLSNYELIHVKKDNQWKMESLRESEILVPTSAREQLKGLDWMIGDWIDQDGSGKIETSCRWTTNGSFMNRSFKVSNGNDIELEGTQVIGWDPNRKQIRSWVFDSDGGFGEGFWTQSGETWTAEVKFTTSDGRQGRSTNTFTYVNENSFNWRSTNRSLGDEKLGDVKTVVVKRVE